MKTGTILMFMVELLGFVIGAPFIQIIITVCI